MSGIRLGVIGAGNMASAILQGVLKKGLFPVDRILVADPDEAHRAACVALGLVVTGDNREVVRCSDLVVLAVKPQVIDTVLDEIGDLTAGKCLVSIAAGIPISYLRSKTTDAFFVRAMPNTPMLVGMGASAVTLRGDVPRDLYDAALSIFSGSGAVVLIAEEQMNEIIGVNGSSPAFFFRMAEAMRSAAVEMGIDEDTALELIARTMEGSARMLLDSGKTPAELIRQVSSPGGTTLAALTAFDEMGYDALIREAMTRCTKRAYELQK